MRSGGGQKKIYFCRKLPYTLRPEFAKIGEISMAPVLNSITNKIKPIVLPNNKIGRIDGAGSLLCTRVPVTLHRERISVQATTTTKGEGREERAANTIVRNPPGGRGRGICRCNTHLAFEYGRGMKTRNEWEVRRPVGPRPALHGSTANGR